MRKHGILRSEQAARMQRLGARLNGVSLQRMARHGFAQHEHDGGLAFVLARGGFAGNQNMRVVGTHETVLDGLGRHAAAHHARQARHHLGNVIGMNQAGELQACQLRWILRAQQTGSGRVGLHQAPIHGQQYRVGRQPRQRVEIGITPFGHRPGRNRHRTLGGLGAGRNVCRRGSGLSRKELGHGQCDGVSDNGNSDGNEKASRETTRVSTLTTTAR